MRALEGPQAVLRAARRAGAVDWIWQAIVDSGRFSGRLPHLPGVARFVVIPHPPVYPHVSPGLRGEAAVVRDPAGMPDVPGGAASGAGEAV